MLVKEGCFIFRGFGRSDIGEEGSTKRKWEGKKEDLQVQSEIISTSVGYSKRLSRAEG